MGSDLPCRQGCLQAVQELLRSEFSCEIPVLIKHGHLLSRGVYCTASLELSSGLVSAKPGSAPCTRTLLQKGLWNLNYETGLDPQEGTWKSWGEEGFHRGLFTPQAPGPPSAMSTEVETGLSYKLELPRPLSPESWCGGLSPLSASGVRAREWV